jgi:RNA polymerase sigma factor (sigma-70 family)
MKTDAQLIAEARRSPDAFGEVYRRHVRAIHRWFGARTPDGIASELTAETFAQAALSLKRFRDEADGSAGPWLFGIARNLQRRHEERRRVDTKARRRLGMPIRSYELDVDEVSARVEARELAPALAAALGALPPPQRRAVELRVVEELEYADVAALLGCSEGAARLRVMRGLGQLSRVLKGASP